MTQHFDNNQIPEEVRKVFHTAFMSLMENRPVTLKAKAPLLQQYVTDQSMIGWDGLFWGHVPKTIRAIFTSIHPEREAVALIHFFQLQWRVCWDQRNHNQHCQDERITVTAKSLKCD